MANLYTKGGRLISGNSNSAPIIEESFKELICEWKKIVKTFPPALYLGESATVTKRKFRVHLGDRYNGSRVYDMLNVWVEYDLNDKIMSWSM